MVALSNEEEGVEEARVAVAPMAGITAWVMVAGKGAPRAAGDEVLTVVLAAGVREAAEDKEEEEDKADTIDEAGNVDGCRC